MAEVQTSYANSLPVGFAGMIANGETSNRISRSADEAIGFGQPAYRGATVHTCQAGATFSATAVGAAGASAPAGATITASPTITAGAKPGVYNIVCTVGGATTTSKWQVEDPDGVLVGVATGNTAFSGGGLAFTITDSGTDPVVGEQFIITVTFAEDASFLGLTVADKGASVSSSTPDQYPIYANVDIMTSGVMWVTAGATVVAGDDVYWNPATSRFTKTTTHIRIPNAVFDTGGADGGLVRVAIRH